MMRILLMLALVCLGRVSSAATICVYQDINYGGAKYCWNTAQAGGANFVDLGWQKTVSSVTIEGTAVVDFYDQANYTGTMARVNFSLADLRGVNFNDRALSAKAYMPAGRACFFWDANFMNAYRCYFPGDMVPNLVQLNWNDGISSVRLDGDVSAYLYRDIGFAGSRLWVRQTTPNLQAYPGWNDSTSSIHIVHANGQ